jgi:type IV pilus assembly protein PilV
MMITSYRFIGDSPRQSGFSLLEVLITLIILSIGLLGIAAMQLKGLQSAHSAYHRTLASTIAVDGSERLWATLVDGKVDVPKAQASWRANWPAGSATLPELVLTIQGPNPANSTTYQFIVQWQEGRFGNETVTTFEYGSTFLPNRGGT